MRSELGGEDMEIESKRLVNVEGKDCERLLAFR